MPLADFILGNMDRILLQWQAAGASRPPASRSLKASALRDHAAGVLRAIVKDISRSRGHAAVDASETSAEALGFLNSQTGFEINQMAGEYRALRTGVLQMWIDSCHPDTPPLNEIIRFNEAIDQLLDESNGLFSARVEEARNLFLGMLGHDMRTPLQAIQMTATYLSLLNAGREVSEAAAHLTSSSARMKLLLDNLVEFNRSNLGLGIPIARSDVDMAELFTEELDQIRAAHPYGRVEVEVSGATRGSWDGLSVQRLLGNLVVNAIKYGSADTPVRVLLVGQENEIQFEVRNSGAHIPQEKLDAMFAPLRRGLHDQDEPTWDGSLGLGLYIAREIARAHGGELRARSEQTETIFAVRLPRHG